MEGLKQIKKGLNIKKAVKNVQTISAPFGFLKCISFAMTIGIITMYYYTTVLYYTTMVISILYCTVRYQAQMVESLTSLEAKKNIEQAEALKDLRRQLQIVIDDAMAEKNEYLALYHKVTHHRFH